jgi:stage V sporulation protein AA
MTSAPVSTMYIRLRKQVRIRRGNPIRLGDVAQIIVDPDLEAQLNELQLMKPNDTDGNIVLIDIMLIIERVKPLYPLMQIEHYGEPHTLIEVFTEVKRPSIVWIVAAWFLLFIGSGLAIMNFHEDVSMGEVHSRIYELLTGQKLEHPLLMQIPYSIGIGAGMIVFFNHLFKKKFNEEPSPLEVEMFMYQESVNHYVITEEYSKIHRKKKVR